VVQLCLPLPLFPWCEVCLFPRENAEVIGMGGEIYDVYRCVLMNNHGMVLKMTFFGNVEVRKMDIKRFLRVGEWAL
jgi:hypothetical protein